MTASALPLNPDATIEMIYQLQVDLQIFADWMARQTEPVSSQGAILSIARMHRDLLLYSMPSLLRH